ncbi:uncharacterized protein CC84DRAFT_1204027 [Paraphaeosphaeria sporulosa]|uniref:Uncharacterized protein n=1 Tax=Paraphaeosphaeria sporulosa TaxID=1460663 RepID=A0A177CNF8_9PLEO|nr:uncharacterized protein CC84DRAFT_1204027 [Paraphaeosphaeria sporulosa]OAG08741.1 hypothetical protein CC84DRAFT_1204027 [Paraphaeosphaeria sporulosa]
MPRWAPRESTFPYGAKNVVENGNHNHCYRRLVKHLLWTDLPSSANQFNLRAYESRFLTTITRSFHWHKTSGQWHQYTVLVRIANLTPGPVGINFDKEYANEYGLAIRKKFCTSRKLYQLIKTKKPEETIFVPIQVDAGQDVLKVEFQLKGDLVAKDGNLLEEDTTTKDDSQFESADEDFAKAWVQTDSASSKV